MPPAITNMLDKVKRVTVMGLGRFGGGIGAARFFAQAGKEVIVTDLLEASELEKSIVKLADVPVIFHLGKHDIKDFTDTDLVLANQAARPDNPYLLEARKHGVRIITETGLALALNTSRWLGVTGSGGKSTTSAMLAAILSHRYPDTLFGGNIGGSLLTRIGDHPVTMPVVVELSSFQLIHIGPQLASGQIPSPRVAVVTNLAPNHLDWHTDLDEYYSAKKNLVQFQKADDWTILNVDDPELAHWIDGCPGRVIATSLADNGRADSCHIDGEDIVLRLNGKNTFTLPVRSVRLPGRHNLRNAIQAVAAGYAFCGDAEAVAAGVGEFNGLPHRLENSAEVGGRIFINDSKSTTPDAAILALSSFAQPCVLIAGGYDKQSPFDQLGQAIQQHADGLVLVGEAADRIRHAVESAAASRPAEKGRLKIAECGADFDQAVKTAFDLTPAGGIVLLSPACASWGMFSNYEERGERFRQLAKEIAQKC